MTRLHRSEGVSDASDAGGHGGDFGGGIGVGELAGGSAHPCEVVAVAEKRGDGLGETVGSEVGLRQKQRRVGVGQSLGVEALMVVGGGRKWDEDGWLSRLRRLRRRCWLRSGKSAGRRGRRLRACRR